MAKSRAARLRTSAANALSVCCMAVIGSSFVSAQPSASPDRSRTIQVPGLKRQVEIVVDRWGVPHIFAKS